ncbi:MAG: tetratricopeptide repeat protein [Acidobacteriota bacterium]
MKKSQTSKAGEPGRWQPWALAGAAAVLAFLVYRPALGGDFVFDDRYLPILGRGAANSWLGDWVGWNRPILMLSFWLQLRLFGQEPYSYHLANLLLHLVNSALVFVIARRLIGWAGESGRRNAFLAGFAAALFLLHPLQTESVSYIASRSEALSATFFLGSLAVFLGRRSEAVSWSNAALALALFGAAVLTKEHTAVLPALFLLTDYYWNPGFSLAGIKKNWRLHAPVLLLGAGGLVFVWRALQQSGRTAGFRVEGVAWYEYFFTQCRVIWTYIRLYVLPVGQNLDPDIPISRGLLDHGAVIGLAGLAALAAAAWMWRKREPLASYGVLAFLLLLAPTSSIVPIRDLAAERRMYLPILGLILATIALMRRWRAGTGALTAVIALVAFATYQRNQVWAGSIGLWADTVAGSPSKVRPRFQLAFAYYEAGRCGEAAREFETASKLGQPNYELLVDWGLALDCDGQYQAAVERFEHAARLESTAHVYALLGMVHGKRGNRQMALVALARAESIDKNYDMTYAYRGNLFFVADDFERAAAEFRRALGLNPSNPAAQQGLRAAEGRLRAPR